MLSSVVGDSMACPPLISGHLLNRDGVFPGKGSVLLGFPTGGIFEAERAVRHPLYSGHSTIGSRNPLSLAGDRVGPGEGFSLVGDAQGFQSSANDALVGS